MEQMYINVVENLANNAGSKDCTLKLSPQYEKIIAFCAGKEKVNFEELVQFSKDSGNVKLKTMQRAVSDIRKIFKDHSLPDPFTCKFGVLVETKKPVVLTLVPAVPQEQELVRMRITKGGRKVRADDLTPDILIDYVIDKQYKHIKTYNGTFNLSPDEWEVFCYFHENHGKRISIEELRDKVVYKNYGTSTPHHWADSIKRILGGLRTKIPGLKCKENRSKDRLVRVTCGDISYYVLE
jgi:hypothetical protein